MAKITITLDTETKEKKLVVNNEEYEFSEICIYNYNEGFDFRAGLKPEVENDVTEYKSLVAYAKEKDFCAKAFAETKFLDDKNSLVLVKEKKLVKKTADWLKSNLK